MRLVHRNTPSGRIRETELPTGIRLRLHLHGITLTIPGPGSKEDNLNFTDWLYLRIHNPARQVCEIAGLVWAV